MKTVRQPQKSVSDISLLQMTIKLALLAGFFLLSGYCILLAVKSIFGIFD